MAPWRADFKRVRGLFLDCRTSAVKRACLSAQADPGRILSSKARMRFQGVGVKYRKDSEGTYIDYEPGGMVEITTAMALWWLAKVLVVTVAGTLFILWLVFGVWG